MDEPISMKLTFFMKEDKSRGVIEGR